MISDSLKLQLYQHRGQLNLLKVEVYFKPPHLNIALWGEWEGGSRDVNYVVQTRGGRGLGLANFLQKGPS